MAELTSLREFQRETMRGLIDESLENRTPSFADRFLPEVQTYSTTFAYDIIKTNTHIAAMIGVGAEPPVIDRDAVASMHGKIAKFGIKYIATEEELMALFQARNSGERQNVVDKLLVKATDLAAMVQRRFDVTKLQAIGLGKFVYNDNNVKVDVDFGIPEAHKKTLTTTDKWNDAGSDPVGNLQDWVKTYVDTNGKQPDVIYVSREVATALMKNPSMVLESGRPAGVTRATLDDVRAVLDSYGLPQIEIVDDRSITVKNVYTGENEVIEFFPANRVVMISEGLGEFLVGPTVENNFQPGVFVDAYDKKEPIESILRAVGAGFPAIANPALLFHADVM